MQSSPGTPTGTGWSRRRARRTGCWRSVADDDGLDPARPAIAEEWTVVSVGPYRFQSAAHRGNTIGQVALQSFAAAEDLEA